MTRLFRVLALCRVMPVVAVTAILAAFPAHAQTPPYRPPGGLAIGGTNGAAKSAAATAGAATLASQGGVITTEAITTAAGGTYTLTLTDTLIAATDQVFASVAYGTSTTGTPTVTRVQPAAGSLVIVVQNVHASAAFNGTVKIAFVALKN